MRLAPTVAKGPSRKTLVHRALVALAVTAFLVVGPIGQVAGVSLRTPQQWRMFTGKGRRVCQVAFDRVAANGTTTRLNHLRILGLERTRSKLRIDRRQLEYFSRAMCRSVARLERSNAQPDLRLHARCGSRGQWRDFSNNERSICDR